MKTMILVTFFAFILFYTVASSLDSPKQIGESVVLLPKNVREKEIGVVKWNRNLDRVAQTAKSKNKPIFMLFQEVPGWQTCIDFGIGPMSHRLLVESIEKDFVPALVYNNKKEDADKLKRFKEPSWNNPVIRFFDAEWNDVIARKDRVWEMGAVANRMIMALKGANSKDPKYVVPKHLELTALQFSEKTEHASFAMHCYWEGEVQFGGIEGVKQTQSAWYDGKEIVNVSFDPNIVSYQSIVETALKVRCASTVYTRSESQQKIATEFASDHTESIAEKEFGRPAKPSDQKYYLQNSPLRLLPLTSVQAVRVNSALGRRSKPNPFLKVTQYKMLKAIQSKLPNHPELAEALSTAKAKMDFNSYYDFAKKNLLSDERK